MEGKPAFHEFDWRGLAPALAGGVRLVVPILVVGELDDLRHDNKAERQEKARIATRKLIELHKGKPTVPAPLPTRPGVTIEVLLDEGWHHRNPNSDAEIIEQAAAAARRDG